MSKRLKTYWLIRLLAADDPLFFIISTFNNLNIDPDTAYCIVTLFMRLCKKRYIKCSNTKNFKTFENRVLDAEEITGRSEKLAIAYYNKNLFDWEEDVGNIYPKRHY